MTQPTYLWNPPPVYSLPVRGRKERLPINRLFFVGRNYHAHAVEIGRPVDKSSAQLFYFTKAPSTLGELRVLEYLRHKLHCGAEAIDAWCATWIGEGFDALEAPLGADTERSGFCFGDSPTLADVYLIPRTESARRFNVNVLRWLNICAVDAACSRLDAFRLAAPDRQPDAAA